MQTHINLRFRYVPVNQLPGIVIDSINIFEQEYHNRKELVRYVKRGWVTFVYHSGVFIYHFNTQQVYHAQGNQTL